MAAPPSALVLHVQREYACRGVRVPLERAEAATRIRLGRRPVPVEVRGRVAEDRLRRLDELHEEEMRLTEHLSGANVVGAVAQEEEAASGSTQGSNPSARRRRVAESKPSGAVDVPPAQGRLF